MQFSTSFGGHEEQIAALFDTTFTASEGAEEGARIGQLALNLLRGTDRKDLFAFTAKHADTLMGCIIFSRLRFNASDRKVFLLAPVAVLPDHQRRGIGKKLISHGLNHLCDHGVELAVTYGDPSYYSQTGFLPLDPATVPPPLPLSMPQGWLGQSLVGKAMQPIRGPSTCVAALNDPVFW
jgi:predicted N-acetyltransferase YhbS